ncbi:MAG: hypothetical protein K0U20_09325 [Proteobacteria bacterium]|nr:hypothetical protein [Pseudomonadota bacterium]MCH9735781.1 hypothetical protein [Actinomycetes bacterium]
MADLVFNLEEVEAVEEAQERSFGLIDTGVYKNAEIVRAVLGKTKKGNNILDVTVKTEDGHEVTVYQAYCVDTKWASGADNKYGYEAWLRFAKVVGIKSFNTFQEAITDADGKPILKKSDQTPIVFNTLKDSVGKKCDVAIQKVFGYYNNEVTEKNEIYDVYAVGSERSDKVASRLKDKEDADYKQAFANGDTNAPEEVEEDVGSLI